MMFCTVSYRVVVNAYACRWRRTASARVERAGVSDRGERLLDGPRRSGYLAPGQADAEAMNRFGNSSGRWRGRRGSCRPAQVRSTGPGGRQRGIGSVVLEIAGQVEQPRSSHFHSLGSAPAWSARRRSRRSCGRNSASREAAAPGRPRRNWPAASRRVPGSAAPAAACACEVARAPKMRWHRPRRCAASARSVRHAARIAWSLMRVSP